MESVVGLSFLLIMIKERRYLNIVYIAMVLEREKNPKWLLGKNIRINMLRKLFLLFG